MYTESWKPQAQRGRVEEEEKDAMKEAEEDSERQVESSAAQKAKKRTGQDVGNGQQCPVFLQSHHEPRVAWGRRWSPKRSEAHPPKKTGSTWDGMVE